MRISTSTARTPTRTDRPPELMLGAKLYSTEVDCWSLGCIMAELLTGSVLLPGQGEIDELRRTFDLLGPPPTEDSWQRLRSLPGAARFRVLEGPKHAKAKGKGKRKGGANGGPENVSKAEQQRRDHQAAITRARADARFREILPRMSMIAGGSRGGGNAYLSDTGMVRPCLLACLLACLLG